MILEKQPLTLAEVKEIVDGFEEKQEMKNYFKKFTKLTKEQALELKGELENLNNPRLNEEKIVKIVDFLPEDKEDMAKIFIDTTLEEEETNEILEIVKKYR